MCAYMNYITVNYCASFKISIWIQKTHVTFFFGYCNLQRMH